MILVNNACLDKRRDSASVVRAAAGYQYDEAYRANRMGPTRAVIPIGRYRKQNIPRYRGINDDPSLVLASGMFAFEICLSSIVSSG